MASATAAVGSSARLAAAGGVRAVTKGLDAPIATRGTALPSPCPASAGPAPGSPGTSQIRPDSSSCAPPRWARRATMLSPPATWVSIEAIDRARLSGARTWMRLRAVPAALRRQRRCRLPPAVEPGDVARQEPGQPGSSGVRHRAGTARAARTGSGQLCEYLSEGHRSHPALVSRRDAPLPARRSPDDNQLAAWSHSAPCRPGRSQAAAACPGGGPASRPRRALAGSPPTGSLAWP
jgi:hypothetical protein